MTSYEILSLEAKGEGDVSGFLCMSSHCLIPSRVSSLVVQGLGVSAPTPKAQALISFPRKPEGKILEDWEYPCFSSACYNVWPIAEARCVIWSS